MIIGHTDRIIVRKFKRNDVNDLFEVLGNPIVMKFSVNGPESIEQTKEVIEETISRYKEKGFGIWAIEANDSKKVIGYCGFYIQLIDGKEEIELSYRLNVDYWRKGYATEAANIAVDWIFTRDGVKNIISIIEKENSNSIKVVEKLGMKVIKETDFHNIPVVIYGMEKSEYKRDKRLC